MHQHAVDERLHHLDLIQGQDLDVIQGLANIRVRQDQEVTLPVACPVEPSPINFVGCNDRPVSRLRVCDVLERGDWRR